MRFMHGPMAASMSDVLKHVTTPLALAALLFLLAAPSLKILLKERVPPATAKMLIRYGFILGITMGVLAILSSVYTSTFNREIRLSGSVRDEGGQPLIGATVNVPGRGAGPTDSQGNFAFTIPDARAADAYDAEVYLEGYVSKRVHLQGRYPEPFAVQLKRPPVATDRLLALPDGMVVRHNLGCPQMDLSLKFTNPFPSEITVVGISVALVKPSGEVIQMPMEGMYMPNGQPFPPLPQWNLKKGESVTLSYSFFAADIELIQLQQRAALEVQNHLSEIRSPDPEANLLSPELVQRLRAYLDAHFIWAAGEWQLRAMCQVGDQSFSKTSRFKMKEEDVARMKGIQKYYPAGLGVFPAWRYWSTTDAQPTVGVVLRPA